MIRVQPFKPLELNYLEWEGKTPLEEGVGGRERGGVYHSANKKAQVY